MTYVLLDLAAQKQRVSTEARLLPRPAANFPRELLHLDGATSGNIKGAYCDDELSDPAAPKNYDAKSRLIFQGFLDHDIAVLNRTAPAPSTSDVPLALQ
eukprot:2170696-Pyramimonas_sp.AAC.1